MAGVHPRRSPVKRLSPAVVLAPALAPFPADDAYEVLREYETETGWAPVRMQLKKVVRK
jgi:hypothetical protein